MYIPMYCRILKFSYKAPGIETMINLDEIHPFLSHVAVFRLG